MAVNALQYMKNVGKSFGYSAIDTFKKSNPQVTTLASGAKEFSSDLYSSIRDFKSSIKNTKSNDEKSLFGTSKDIINEYKNNLFEDLKSGNWYNKQRIEANENEIAKDMFGLDLDDLDRDFDDFDSEDSDEILESVSEKQSAAAIINGMDAVGSKSANAISNATVRSADYIAASQRQSSKALYSLNQRGFLQVSSGLAAVNANISQLVTLAEPLTKHMQNSATFYIHTEEYHKSVLEKLDTVIKLMTPEEDKKASRKTSMSDIMTAEGTIDFQAWYDFIKGNVKRKKDDSLGLLNAFGGTNTIKKMATGSPMKVITDTVVQTIFDATLKDSMDEFNKTLGSFFSPMLSKARNKKFNGLFGDIFDFAKEIIFPPDVLGKSVNTANYKHGRVDWSGESEMALKEVIPTYLAAITSALTGGPMTQYDYRRGAFVVRSAVKNLNDQRLSDAGKRAGGNFRKDALTAVNSLNLSDEDRNRITQDIENYFTKAIEKGSAEAANVSRDDFNYNAFDMSKDAQKVLQEVLKSYNQLNKQYEALSFLSEVDNQRERYTNATKRIEAENGVERSIFDNSSVITEGNDKFKKGAPSLLLGTDEYGNNIFFYLQELYKSNWVLADNMDLFGSGVGGGFGKGGKLTYTPRDYTEVRDIKRGSSITISQNDVSNQNSSTIRRNSGNVSVDDLAEAISKSVKDSVDTRGEGTKRKSGDRTTEEIEAEKEQKRWEEANGIVSDDSSPRGKSGGERLVERVDNLRSGVYKKIRDNLYKFFKSPADIMGKILDSGQQSMYNLIFGKEGSDETGIFGYFFKKGDELFDKFDNFLKDKFDVSIKALIEKFKSKEFWQNFADDTKQELKNAGNWAKDKISGWFGFGSKGKPKSPGEGETAPIDNGTAAYGRKVTKTGVVSVSEGELIIPAKYNPFYHGNTDQKTQIKNEKNQALKFFGNYAEGGTIKDKIDDISDSAKEKIISAAGDILKDQAKKKVDKTKNSIKDKVTGAGQSIKDFADDKFGVDVEKEGQNAGTLLKASVGKLVSGFGTFVDALIPKDIKTESKIINTLTSDETKKQVKEANIGQEIKDNKGALGAGAVIGAGASILTGCVVGPLAGAAIGAGVGLVVKSEKVQKLLFGDDEHKGLLPEDVANFIQKKVPNIGLGAALGGGVGLFMGSPILGAFVGGSISFLAQSDRFKNFIFGEKDENGNRTGGVISKAVQDKVKKAAPNIGAGILAGMIAGPFGIVGNIVLGSALGYASTTDMFANKILGKPNEKGERTGGIVGAFRGYLFGYENAKGKHKQGVFESVVGIFNKVANEIRIHSKNIFKSVTKSLRRTIQNALGFTAKQLFGSIANSVPGKIVKGGLTAAAGAVIAPFLGVRAGLEGIDKSLGRRALKRGYNLTNDKGEKMTSTERQEAAKAYGMTNYGKTEGGKFDARISGMDEGQLRELSQTLKYIEDPAKQYEDQKFKQRQELAGQLEEYGVDDTLARKLENAANGKYSIGSQLRGETFSDILDKADLTDEQRQAIMNQYGAIQDSEAKRKDAKAKADEYRKKLLDKNELGFDVNEGNAGKYRELVENDLDKRFAPKTEEEKAKDKQNQVQDAVIETKDSVVENKETTKSIKDILSDIYMYGIGRGKRPGEEDKSEEAKEESSEEENKEESKEESKTAKDIVNDTETKPNNKVEVDNGLDNKEGVTTQIDPITGQPIQFVDNNQGEATVDVSDSETKNTMALKQKITNAILSIPVIGAGMKGLGSVFGGLKDTLFGSKDKEGGGLFGKLFSTFFGEDSFVGGIFGTLKSALFGDTGILKLGKSGVGAFLKSSIPTVLTTVLAGGALVGLFGGWFDDLGKKITGGAYGDDTGKTVATDEENKPHELQTDEKGNPLTDEDGDYIDTDGNKVPKDSVTLQYDVGARDSVHTKAIKNLGTSLLTGGSSVASTLVKVITKDKVNLSGEAIGGVLSDIATNGANSGMIQSILQGLSSFLEKIPTFIQSCPIIPSSIKEKVADKADDFVIFVYDKLADKISGLAESKLGSIAQGISNVLGYVNVAATVLILVNGWTGAEAILKVEEASTGQRLIGALVALINSRLPVIANFIPNDLLVDIFLKACDMIGIDMSSLEQQRAELTEKVAQYNAENGTNFTEYEYLDYQGKTGLVNNVVKGGKNLIRNAGNMAKGAASKVGEFVTGAGNAISGAASSVYEGAKGLATSARDKVTDFAGGVKDTVSGAASKIAEGASNIIADIKSVVNVVPEEIDTMKKLTADKDSTFEDITNIPEDTGSFAGISHILRIATRALYIPTALISAIGKKIGNVVNGIIDGIKTMNKDMITNTASISKLALSGDVSGTLNYKYEADEKNPLGAIHKVTFNLNKVIYVPIAAVSAIGKKISEFVGNIIDTVKEATINNVQQNINISELAKSGDIDGVLNFEYQDVEGNPLSGVQKATFFLNKIIYVPVAAVAHVGNKISEFISNVTDTIVNANANNVKNAENLSSYAQDGDLDGLWSQEYEEIEDNPLDGIYKATFFVNKITYTPLALFKKVTTSVGNFITTKSDAIKTDYSTLQSNMEKMSKYAQDGKISEIWSIKFEASDENPIGAIFGGITNINKIFYTLGAIGHNLFGAVGNFLGNAASTVKDKAASAVNTVKDTASNALNSAWSAFKGFVGSGSGVSNYRGRGSVSKKNDTFVSQYDPDYADMKLGDSTVSDLGCAPATATMMANFIKPGSMKMTDAVNKAAKYESDEGTSADYFKSVLNSKGLKTDYIETNNKSSRDDLIKSIASGKPAVLLGEDTSNDSKTASPFGPSAHYVMAKGFDKNGNVIINDPESDTPNKAYSSNILNNVKLGVLSDQDVFEEDTDDSVNYIKKTGALNFTGGAGVPDNEIARNVYGFFTSRGYSPAAAAGILGNANQESGVNPAMIQGNGKGPAAGLFQWENYNKKDSRWLAMNNYAASKGKDWTDLDSQLEYALTEIESSDINNRMSKNHNVTDTDGKVYNIKAVDGVEGFKKLTDPIQAMQVFEASFERAGKPGFANREKYAQEYYNLYSGSTYTGNYDSSVGTATGGTSYDSSTGTSSSSSSSSGGILGAISSAFTSVLGGLLGLGSSDTSSSSSSTSTDSGSYTTIDGSLGAASTPDGQGTAQSFVDMAKSQLGVVEGVDNITPYGKFTGTDGAAWCAAFVSWVMNKAFNGDDAAAKKALRGGYSAAVSTLWKQFQDANAMSTTPQVGDVVIYKNGSSHTGIVETVNGNNITTIEGNTSGDNSYNREANGGMVARKSFDYTQHSKLTGFGRPDWDAAAQTAIANGSIKSSTGSTLKEGSSSAGDLSRDFYGSGSRLIGINKFNNDSQNSNILDKLESRERSKNTENVAKLKQTKAVNGKKLKYYSGGASSTDSDTSTISSSPSDTTSIIALLKTIVTTLKTVATNTTDISTISTTLTNYANSTNTTKVSAASNNTSTYSSNSSITNSKVDPSNDPALKDLMNTLGAIAEG